MNAAATYDLRWRAQFEHASGEALLEALNRRFYQRLRELGIEPMIGPRHQDC